MSVLYRKANYLKSAFYLKDLPLDQGLEVAFIGRSNAGKSTAINMITQQKQLAKVSKQPGRTQLINFFALDEQRKLVDLPGYGYAKVPFDLKQHWQKTLTQFLENRKALKGLILVMDIRHPLQESDILMLKWCQHYTIPVHILLTKADKLKHGAMAKTQLEVAKKIKDFTTPVSIQVFSALNKIGLEECYQVLDEWFEIKKSPQLHKGVLEGEGGNEAEA